MSCTIAAFAQCLTWAAVHLDGGLAYQVSSPNPPQSQCHNARLCVWPYDLNHVNNPYGIAAVGYEVDFARITWDLELRHQSSIPEHDYGSNTAQLTFSWHPFGGR